MVKSYYILTTLFILVFVSCRNKEEDFFTDTNSKKCSFLLDTQKAELSSYWSTENIIGITAYMSDSDELYLNNANRQYKSNAGGTFDPVTEGDKIPHPIEGNYVDFIAYYPYKADVETTYAIYLSEQSNQKQLDVLYSNNATNITNTSGNVKFTFNHILSKIVINTIPSGSLDNNDLHDMNITINNISNEGTLYLLDGRIEHSHQKSSIKMKTAANGSSSEAIVFPGSTSEISFTVELTNGNIYSANFHQQQQLVSGHIHTYNITITQTGISLSPLEIEDWVLVDNHPQEEIADEIIYKTGDFYPNPNNPKTAIGIVYWLKPGTGGKEGKIISFDSANKSWGDSGNENLKTSISTGIINWYILINRDPSLDNFPAFKWCMDKGKGWYLPSRYELHVLNEIWTDNKEHMNSNIELVNGEPFTSDDIYLASSESRSWPADRAETYYFSNKGWRPIYKIEVGRIRAFKEF
jgi:hypothetical protein